MENVDDGECIVDLCFNLNFGCLLMVIEIGIYGVGDVKVEFWKLC